MRLLDQPGRSTVLAMNGMAATSSPLSTAKAIQVLQQGGNAMDAAIAAVAVQCVVEPQSTGIGGDMFCLYKPHNSGLVGFLVRLVSLDSLQLLTSLRSFVVRLKFNCVAV